MAKRRREPATPIELAARLGLVVERLRAEPDVLAVFLYGSYGTLTHGPLSDIDLALLFRPARTPDRAREFEIRGAILGVLGENDVSITLLERSDPIFQHEVLRTGRMLLCTDPSALADFVEHVLDRHADFVVDHERFLAEYDAALHEAVVTGRDVT